MNAIVAASPAVISELQKLRMLLQDLGVHLQGSCINITLHGEPIRGLSLPDLGPRRLGSYRGSYLINVGHDSFRRSSISLEAIKRTDNGEAKVSESNNAPNWGDGRCRLIAMPSGLFSVVMRKPKTEGGKEVILAPNWPA